MSKRKRQTRLIFDPTAPDEDAPGSSNSGSSFSPAKVRFSSQVMKSSPLKGSSPAMTQACGRKKKKKKQKTLQDSLGKSARRRSSQRQGLSPPPSSRPQASFMPKIHGSKGLGAAATDSSEESAVEDHIAVRADSTDDEEATLPPIVNLPPRLSQSISTKLEQTIISDDDVLDDENYGGPVFSASRRDLAKVKSEDEEDSDDGPILPSSSHRKRDKAPVESDSDDAPLVPSSSRRGRKQTVKVQSDNDEDAAEDDSPIMPSSSRRRRPKVVQLDSDNEVSILSPIKRRKLIHGPTSSNKQSAETDDVQVPYPTKWPKGHRSEKQKKMELLRRRRAGEKIDKLTSSESESESGDNDMKRGLYDSDNEDGFQGLTEFYDDEEEVQAVSDGEAGSDGPTQKQSKKPTKLSKSDDNSGSDDDNLDDFVVEDDDAPLGVPAEALAAIPLEFTAQAHKPLKQQFPHVIEWLVHNKINPSFERRDPIYLNAWRKLDDEVHGLASSKFTSAAWKPIFYRALRARPKIETYEMVDGDPDKHATCEACGRSGHPATFIITFAGHPYHKDSLAEVESDSDSNSNSDDDEEEDDSSTKNDSVDTQGNPLPPNSKQWIVGSVCCSNAETAHSLIHWKHALKEWVEDRLEQDGWFAAPKLKKREKMKARKRRHLANKIVDDWQEQGIISALHSDFKQNLENARHKSTTGRGGRTYRR